MVLRLYPNFRLLWLGQVVSVVGDGMQRIALLWWAKHTGGNGLLTAVAACSMIPMIVCSPIGGWAADRFDRRTLMAGADVARVLTTATLAVLLLSGNAPVIVVCALVALTAVGAALFDPTYAASVPSLVAEADRPAANGLNIANTAVGGLVGPLVGGGLIALFDVGTVMVVNALTFVWSAALVLRSAVPSPPATVTPESPTPREGARNQGAIRLVLGDVSIRRLVGLASVLNLVVAPVPLLIVSLAVDEFDVGPTEYTFMAVMLSAGMLAGSLMASRLARLPVGISMSAVGLSFMATGTLPLVGVCVALVACGVAISAVNTTLVTTFQSAVPANVQGGVFGVMGSMSEGLRPLGLVMAGPLLAGLGVRVALIVVGLAVVVAAIGWTTPSRSRAGGRRRTAGRPRPNHGHRPADLKPFEHSHRLATSVARPAHHRLV